MPKGAWGKRFGISTSHIAYEIMFGNTTIRTNTRPIYKIELIDSVLIILNESFGRETLLVILLAQHITRESYFNGGDEYEYTRKLLSEMLKEGETLSDEDFNFLM